MANKVTRWQPALRPSRKLIREWLEENGPASPTEVVTFIRTLGSAWTAEQLAADLSAHPRLFRSDDGDRWEAAPQDDFRVVVQRPRPRPRPRRRRKRSPRETVRTPTPAGSKPPSPPQPDSQPPLHDTGHGSEAITFGQRSGASSFESGKRILVTIPATVGKTADQMVTALEQPEPPTPIFEKIGEKSRYRGRREVLEAWVAPGGNEVRAVLGPTEDSDPGGLAGLAAFRPTLDMLLLGAGPGTPRDVALSPAELAPALEVPEKLRALLNARPPLSKHNRKKAYDQANRRLRKVSTGAAKWSDVSNWLIQQKPTYDQELIENILTMAIHMDGINARPVIESARLLLADTEPKSVKYCRAFAIRAADLGQEDICTWASHLVAHALSEYANDPALMQAAGKIHLANGRLDAACEFFARTSTYEPLAPSDLEMHLFAASETGDPDTAVAALKSLDRTIQKNREDIAACVDALKFAPLLAATKAERITRTVQLLLAQIERDEREAVQQAEIAIAGQDLKFQEKLQVLSVMESLESIECLNTVKSDLSRVLSSAMDTTRRDLVLEGIAQLRYLEDLIGSDGDNESDIYLDLLGTGETEPVVEDAGLPLQGLRITLVGGRQSTRDRAEAVLEENGVVRVDHVASSREESLDEKAIRLRVQDADAVVLLTDCVGHDRQSALRNLKSKGLGFELIFTSGGPTHILRAVIDRMSKGGASAK